MTGGCSRHLSQLTARLRAENTTFTSRNSFPQKEVGFVVDDKSALKSLEQRVNRLAVGMDNMQKTLDRFVTLYESEKSQTLAEQEDQEKLKKDMVAAKNRERQLEIKVVGMRLQMDILINNCNRDKLQWEQERDQLQKELQHYKSLSQKGPTDDSSTQTTGLFNDSSKSQRIAEAKQEQSNRWKGNHHCTCTIFKPQFAQRTNYDQLVTWRDPVVAPKIKKNRAEHVSQARLPIKKVIIREYTESQQFQKNAESKEELEQKCEQKIQEEQTFEQKLQEPLVAQSEPKIELWSILLPAATKSKARMINAPIHPSVNHSKPNARQQLLVSLLEKHDCVHPECSVLMFLNWIRHAAECAIGSQCNWLICNRMHARTEHLKVCDDKLQCELCQQRSDIANEGKIREIVMLLENTCVPNSMSSYPKNVSTKRAITDLAVRVAVNYGLIGDSVDTVTAEMAQLQDMADVKSSSSSSSKEDISDKEEWSVGEKTLEGWEIVEY